MTISGGRLPWANAPGAPKVITRVRLMSSIHDTNGLCLIFLSPKNYDFFAYRQGDCLVVELAEQ
jgi:hypothetical protein